MKKVVSLLLSLALAATMVGSALAMTGGNNTEIAPVDAEQPQTLCVERELETVTVPFKTLPDGSQLQMMIILPPEGSYEGEKAPCIVMTRGSGLRAVALSAMKNYMTQLQLFAQQGYVVAAMEFRGYTTEPMEMGMFPAALQDIRAAVRYLKANAETYGIDIDKMGVIGQSSGGWESSLLAMSNGAWAVDVGDDTKETVLGTVYFSEADADAAIAEGKNVVKIDTVEGDIDPNAANYSSKVNCSIDLYGLANLVDIDIENPHNLTAGTSNEEVKFMTAGETTEIWDAQYVYTAANPYWYIDDQDVEEVAILFLHGTGDTRVPPYSTEKFFELTQAKGVESYRYLIPGASHGGPRFLQDDTTTIFVDFFNEQLKGYTGNRVTINQTAGVELSVKLNGEAVAYDSYKLANLTEADKVEVTATAKAGYTYQGIQVVSIDDSYVVTTNDTDEMYYVISGAQCASVTGLSAANQ